MSSKVGQLYFSVVSTYGKICSWTLFIDIDTALSTEMRKKTLEQAR
jgi:hypothetical protein